MKKAVEKAPTVVFSGPGARFHFLLPRFLSAPALSPSSFSPPNSTSSFSFVRIFRAAAIPLGTQEEREAELTDSNVRISLGSSY